jgi:GNAT superfamily N-acetyltransferase
MYMEHHAKLDDYFMPEENSSAIWANFMRKFLKEKHNVAVAAVENSRIIGYMTASVHTRRPIYKIRKVGLIGDNFVLPQYRRKGVFTGMLEEVLSWMAAQGIEYVEHPVAAKNRLGRTVWKKKGFEDMTVFTKRKIA